MTFLVQHIRSGELGKRPQPLDLAPGQLAVNYNNDTPGLFFRTDTGELMKAGPVHVGTSPPLQVGYSERSLGEMWLDTTDPNGPPLNVWTQGGWRAANVADGTISTQKLADGAVVPSKISLNNTLFPTEDAQFDLGSSLARFNTIYAETIRATDVYTGDLHMKNEKGDWTLIEEETFIKIRNNKTGAEYKLIMEAL